jgi:hypothetical protein
VSQKQDCHARDNDEPIQDVPRTETTSSRSHAWDGRHSPHLRNPRDVSYCIYILLLNNKKLDPRHVIKYPVTDTCTMIHLILNRVVYEVTDTCIRKVIFFLGTDALDPVMRGEINGRKIRGRCYQKELLNCVLSAMQSESAQETENWTVELTHDIENSQTLNNTFHILQFREYSCDVYFKFGDKPAYTFMFEHHLCS